MRFLHISDLHAREDLALRQDRVLGAFLEDVERQGHFDAVIFSGDLAFSARDEEYQLASDHLLIPLIEITGLDPDRIIIAPGNHDISRDLIGTEEEALSKFSPKEFDQLLTDPEELTFYSRRSKNFRRFLEATPLSSPNVSEPLWSQYSFTSSDGSQVAAVALDSSWRATGRPNDADHGQLVIGRENMLRAYDSIPQNTDFTIVALHHPTAWLKQWDREMVEQEFHSSRTDLVCSGHVHTAMPQMHKRAIGSLIWSEAGCLYSGEGYYNSYNIIEVQPDQIELTVRTYYPDRGEFDIGTNTAHGGRLLFPRMSDSHDDKDLSLFADRREYLLESVKTLQQVPSIQHAGLPLHECLVDPVLYPIPHSQVIAARQMSDTDTIPRVDLEEVVDERGNLAILGTSESGLSSALVWFLSRINHEFSVDVVYVDAVDYDRRGGKVESLLRRMSAEGSKPSTSKVVVAIDNVSALRPALQHRLSEYAESSNAQFLFGVDPNDFPKCREQMSCLATARTLHLAPFGRRELRQLATLCEFEDAEEVTDRVLTVVMRESLPRTPYVLLSLLMVINDLGPGTDQWSETSILEAYAGRLLGRDEVNPFGPLDYRRREFLLGVIAQMMVSSQSLFVGRREVEERLNALLDTMGWDSSGGAVIVDLVEHRILVHRSSQLSFGNPALRNLFAAKRMRDDKAFYEEVVAAPLSYGAIIRHYMALTRTGRDVLQAVADACLPELDDVPQESAASLLALELPKKDGPTDPADYWSHGPSSEVERQDKLDDMWDALETDPDAGDWSHERSVILDPLSLLISVLRHSDMVEDYEYKESLFGSSMRAVVGACIDFLGSVGSEEPMLEDTQRLLEESGVKMSVDDVRRFLVLAGIIFAHVESVGLVGEPSLCRMIRRRLGAPTLNEDPLTRLLLCMLQHAARCDGWFSTASDLVASSGNHSAIVVLLRAMVRRTYMESETDAVSRKRLEDLAVELAFAETPPPSGRYGVGQRQQLRNRVVLSLQKQRQQYLGLGEPSIG